MRSGHDEAAMNRLVEEAKARGTCAATGRPFVMVPGHPGAPSPDRLENAYGYVEGNVQFVMAWLNRARGTSRIEDLEEVGAITPEVASRYRQWFADWEKRKAIMKGAA
jgi:hypothetical protein